jgi:leader peptidase (prepilin peptidase) / N-methyltransferase
MLTTFFLIPLFLCWGSFLNVVALRLLNNTSLLNRSACPTCHHKLAWYHLIPLVSWIFLAGRCAFCKRSIPWSYPASEFFTALIFFALFATVPVHYLPAYGFLFSCLLINIHTDSSEMLLLTVCTLGLIPCGIAAAATAFLPITLAESFLGTLLGGGILWLTRWIFWKLRGVEGMGWGDIELLAGIGSFVAPLGVLCTLLIGSCAGSLIGLALLACRRSDDQLRLPFGAFLAAGAIIYCLYGDYLISFFIF